MQTIRLETSRREFVSYADIPPLTPPASTVVWGSRTFNFTNMFHTHESGASHRIYREDLILVVPNPTPRDKP